MYTSKQVREAIEGMEKQEPDNWWPLVKSLLVDLYEGVEKLNGEHALTLKGAKGVARQVKSMREFFDQLQAKLGIGPTPDATADAAPRASAGAPPSQSELEQQMDAAIAGAPAQPQPQPQAQQPQARPQAQSAFPEPARQKRPAPPPIGRTAANGEPLTPEQADLEQQMDAAIGG